VTDGMKDRANELGRLLGQSDEYKALARARERLTNDRDAVEAMNRLDRLTNDRDAVEAMNRLDVLEREISAALHNGQEPPELTKQEYETIFATLQSSVVYQGLVAAQSNFDKILARVNEEIGRGMEAGSQSRIILS
jgi:cell fate (sporulation/competence/biofilm development) regulator YlbF (YheA/YmcA/DUF963 family)